MSDLAVCMIVKNEADTVGAAIDSVSEIASEIIVADTGSTDGTMELLKEKGVTVLRYLWRDDFAEARNAVKALAKSPWILSLDGDEVVAHQDAVTINEWLHSKASQRYQALEIEKRSYVTSKDPQFGLTLCSGQYKEEGYFGAYLSEPNYLLFRNKPEILWNGSIHESIYQSLQDSLCKTAKLAVVLHNYGRTRKREEKQAMYPSLVRKRLDKDPGDAASWFYYGLLLGSEGKASESIEALRKSVRLGKTGHALFALGLSLLRSGEEKKAEIEFVEYLRSYPQDFNAWISLLICAMQRDDMECLDYYLSKALKAKSCRIPEIVRFAQYAANKKDYHSKAEVYAKLLEKVTNT